MTLDELKLIKKVLDDIDNLGYNISPEEKEVLKCQSIIDREIKLKETDFRKETNK